MATVFEAIKNDDRLSIFASILEGTGLGDKLESETNAFTIFAPTDDALRELPDAALEQMSTSDGKELASIILARHILPGKYLYADELRTRSSVEMMNGRRVKVTQDKNVLKLGRANVLTPGFAAKNGVVFAVDKILRPKNI